MARSNTGALSLHESVPGNSSSVQSVLIGDATLIRCCLKGRATVCEKGDYQMLFVRKPTVVVEDDSAARAEASLLAEERGRASGTVAALGILAVMVLILLVGYFAWWAPVNAAQAQDQPTQVIHDTQVVEKPVPGPTTIVNNPPTAPPVINNPTKVIERKEYVPVPVPVPVPDTSGTNNNNGSGDTSGATGDTSGDLGNGSTAGNSRG
jgi:hypothetical protein